jgi:hypothetical protein
MPSLLNINNPTTLDEPFESLPHYILNCQNLSFFDPYCINNYKSLTKVSKVRSQNIGTVKRHFLGQLLPNVKQIVQFPKYLKCSHADVKELQKVLIVIL